VQPFAGKVSELSRLRTARGRNQKNFQPTLGRCAHASDRLYDRPATRQPSMRRKREAWHDGHSSAFVAAPPHSNSPDYGIDMP